MPHELWGFPDTIPGPLWMLNTFFLMLSPALKNFFMYLCWLVTGLNTQEDLSTDLQNFSLWSSLLWSRYSVLQTQASLAVFLRQECKSDPCYSILATSGSQYFIFFNYFKHTEYFKDMYEEPPYPLYLDILPHLYYSF